MEQTKQTISITLDPAVVEEINGMAAKFAVSRSAMMAMLIRLGLDDMGAMIAQGEQMDRRMTSND